MSAPDRGAPQGPPVNPGSPLPPAPALGGDLSLIPPMRNPPIGESENTAQFINDLRGIIPAALKESSWMYTSNLMGMALLTPRLAEAIRYRYKAHAQLLKMKVPKRRITPEYSIWLDNLMLLGTVQTARSTKPEPERKVMSVSSSEVITRPPPTTRKRLLGLI